jgi:hypothetical protein
MKPDLFVRLVPKEGQVVFDRDTITIHQFKSPTTDWHSERTKDDTVRRILSFAPDVHWREMAMNGAFDESEILVV